MKRTPAKHRTRRAHKQGLPANTGGCAPQAVRQHLPHLLIRSPGVDPEGSTQEVAHLL